MQRELRSHAHDMQEKINTFCARFTNLFPQFTKTCTCLLLRPLDLLHRAHDVANRGNELVNRIALNCSSLVEKKLKHI